MRFPVAAVAVCVLSTGQTPEPRRTGVLSQLVRVNLIATDSNSPVRNLKRGDFMVLDQGRKQTISLFAEDTDRSIMGEDSTPAANIFNNVVARRSGPPVNLTVVLIDGLNTNADDCPRARAESKKLMDSLHPADPVAVFSAGSDLVILRDSSTDPHRFVTIDEALNNAFLMSDIHRTDVARRTADTLESIANHIAVMPGRKSLVWLASSFPFHAGGPSANAEQSVIERAVRAMDKADVAIYPVRVSKESNAADGFESLGPETGGKAFDDASQLGLAVREAIADSAATYTLGFFPAADAIDGKYHELTIQVTGHPDVRLRHRRGFYTETGTDAARLRMLESLARAFQAPLESSWLTMAVRAERTDSDGSISLYAGVSPRQLVLEPKGANLIGAFDIIIGQLDAGRLVLKTEHETASMDFDAETYRKALEHGLQIHKVFTIEKGAKQLRVLLQDRGAGVIGSVFIPVSSIPAAIPASK